MKFAIKSGYPRPQLARNEWVNLNGEWDFCFDKNNSGETQGFYKGFNGDYKINVPFAYQSEASGIATEKQCDNIWYSRKINIVANEKKRNILHFEGVDYYCKVYINGKKVFEHEGAYASFSVDITDYIISGENLLVVKCEDSYAIDIPRGKQRWTDSSDDFMCFYVPSSGIYKTVWLETLDVNYIKDIKITPNAHAGNVSFEFFLNQYKKNISIETTVSYAGNVINKTTIQANPYQNIGNINLISQSVVRQFEYWTPQNPKLYDVVVNLYDENVLIDTVTSYFGLRDIDVRGNQIYLNDMIFYQKLLLDQGYYPSGMLTPSSDEEIIKDIITIKEMGFNGIRIHQKIEEKRFIYFCDKLGLAVWCEMPSTQVYSDISKKRMLAEWEEILRQNYNSPSIITWVIYNESWGIAGIYDSKEKQDFINGLYYLTKSYDKTRLIIGNDGWEHVKTDVVTVHCYDQDTDRLKNKYQSIDNAIVKQDKAYRSVFCKGYSYQGQPVILSEFGGTKFKVKKDNSWGYAEVSTAVELKEQLSKLIDVVKSCDFAGYCYTQYADVYQESNGLVDANKNPKISIEEIAKIIK